MSRGTRLASDPGFGPTSVPVWASVSVKVRMRNFQLLFPQSWPCVYCVPIFEHTYLLFVFFICFYSTNHLLSNSVILPNFMSSLLNRDCGHTKRQHVWCYPNITWFSGIMGKIISCLKCLLLWMLPQTLFVCKISEKVENISWQFSQNLKPLLQSSDGQTLADNPWELKLKTLEFMST